MVCCAVLCFEISFTRFDHGTDSGKYIYYGSVVHVIIRLRNALFFGLQSRMHSEIRVLSFRGFAGSSFFVGLVFHYKHVWRALDFRVLFFGIGI